MIKKTLSTLMLSFLLASPPTSIVSATPNFNVDMGMSIIVFDTAQTAVNLISIKKGVPYDESKDPAIRKGTENNEQPQWSFIVMPVVVFVLILLVLGRSKPD